MKFKYSRDMTLFFELHPRLCMIAHALDEFTRLYLKKEILITATVSTLEQDQALHRASPAHREGRAFDVSVREFSQDEVNTILEFCNENEEWENLQYLSKSGVKRIAYFHTGSAPHIHVAIHSRFVHLGPTQYSGV